MKLPIVNLTDDDDLEWRIKNAVGCLQEIIDRDKKIPTKDKVDEARVEAHRLAMEYAIEVVKGIATITPPKRLDAHAQLLRGRDAVTDGAASLLDEVAGWLRGLSTHERRWHDE